MLLRMSRRVHLSLRLPKELSAIIVRCFCRFQNLQSKKFLTLRDLQRME